LSVVVAYLLGGFSNYFLRRQFVSDTVFCLVVMVTIAFVVISFYNKHGEAQAFATGVDWRLIPASVLVLFALWILASLALACSTRLDMIPTLAICSAFFLVGIMSDYIFGQRAYPVWQRDIAEEVSSSRWTYAQKTLLKEMVEKYDRNKDGKVQMGERESLSPADKARLRQAGMGGAWWAVVLYTVTPNWQQFWVADALDTEKTTFPWGYVGLAWVYVLAYVGAVLSVAVVLFEDRELS
jgi:hypothetical protein